jgi:hypothetical protein
LDSTIRLSTEPSILIDEDVLGLHESIAPVITRLAPRPFRFPPDRETNRSALSRPPALGMAAWEGSDLPADEPSQAPVRVQPN